MAHPYVIISTAMSLDGCIDDTSPTRLILSNAEDFEQVDALRADCDAVLVGAGTLRADDPKLLVRSTQRQLQRHANGKPPQPLKITLTTTGRLNPGLQFFQLGDCEKFVYCPDEVRDRLASTIGSLATVIGGGGGAVPPEFVLTDLYDRGVRRLLVEGGSAINTLFLTAGLVDELRLAVAPFFVGEATAPRFVEAGFFPHNQHQRMRLQGVEATGDMAVLHYRLEHHT